MTLRTALEQGIQLLSDAAVPAPRLTAEVLLAHALQRDRVHLISHSNDDLSELAWIHYGRYLHQRMEGIPTQYITKRQEFYGREFRVCPDVLIPRPETEHVVEAALERVAAGDRVLDVGTGSGAIACSLVLERPLKVCAVDISAAAVRVARGNALRLEAAVEFACGDLIECFAGSSFDMIVSNPPYVGLDEQDGLQREVRDHEPHVALFAGQHGNAIYERLVDASRRVLRPGGWLVLELGYKSLEAVRAMMGSGWQQVSATADLAGIPRVLSGRWCP